MVSPLQRPSNFRIEKPRLLLVEGNDDNQFFRRLIERRHGVSEIQQTGIQIDQFAEAAKLSAFLANVIVPALARVPLPARAIGIVRDADSSYGSAFQSLQGALRHANLPVPNAPLENAQGALDGGDDISVVAYIMPDNGSPGDLETLCLNAVRDAPAMPCVNRYIECLQSINHIPRQESKARLRAFLAPNPDDPTVLTGNAIAAGVIPWNSPAFAGVHQFLDMLDAVN